MDALELEFPEITHAVMTALRPYRPKSAEWTPSWNDDLYETYGIIGSELDDLVLDLLTELKKSIPSRAETRNMRAVHTAKDLVEFLAVR
jgi:hypothetical protein